MSKINPLSDLDAYAQAQLNVHSIPAVSLAVWQDGELQQAAAGILNLNTGVEATTDSIFQIGSITKVFTTCLVMQLVDEGLVDLDRPVKQYLRDFQIADRHATETITVRHLLNHTNGIAGDFFPDDQGAEGNLIARYVDRCNLLPLIHPVGEMYSYSNSAFAIAGRLVEVVRGITWYQAMQDHIFSPLGMVNALADPVDVIRYRAAMGHVFDGEDSDRWVLPEKAYLTMGLAPVGTTPTMSAADLITFARAHLDEGLSQSGERWLSAEAVKAMQSGSIELPQASQIMRRHVGLGWDLFDYDATNTRIFGHGGATNGFLAMLKIIPERKAAFAVLLNGFKLSALDAITKDLLVAMADINVTEPDVEDLPYDATALKLVTGRYESFDTVIDVSIREQHLQARFEYKIDPLPPEVLQLKPITKNCFASFTEAAQRRHNLVFLNPDGKREAAYLFNGLRLNKRH